MRIPSLLGFILVVWSSATAVRAQSVPVAVDTVYEEAYHRGYLYNSHIYSLDDLVLLKDSLPEDHPAQPFFKEGLSLERKAAWIMPPSIVALGAGGFMLVQYHNRNVRYPDGTNTLPAANAWIGGALFLAGAAGVSTSFVLRKQARKQYYRAVEQFTPVKNESRFDVSLAPGGLLLRWSF